MKTMNHPLTFILAAAVALQLGQPGCSDAEGPSDPSEASPGAGKSDTWGTPTTTPTLSGSYRSRRAQSIETLVITPENRFRMQRAGVVEEGSYSFHDVRDWKGTLDFSRDDGTLVGSYRTGFQYNYGLLYLINQDTGEHENMWRD
jgi:hypothetical protein